MPSVLIPTPLRKLTAELESVSAIGANIGELIDNLDKAYPGLKDRLCDEAGNVRRFVNIYVNGEDIRFLEEKATAVNDLFIDPGDPVFDPFFEPPNFVAIGIADVSITGDMLPQNRPALEISLLRFVEISGDLIDEFGNVFRIQNTFP